MSAECFKKRSSPDTPENGDITLVTWACVFQSPAHRLSPWVKITLNSDPAHVGRNNTPPMCGWPCLGLHYLIWSISAQILDHVFDDHSYKSINTPAKTQTPDFACKSFEVLLLPSKEGGIEGLLRDWGIAALIHARVCLKILLSKSECVPFESGSPLNWANSPGRQVRGLRGWVYSY